MLDLARVVHVEPTAVPILADLVEAVRGSGREVFVCGVAHHALAMDALDLVLDAREGGAAVRRFVDADHAREWCEDRILDTDSGLGSEANDLEGDDAEVALLHGLCAEDAAAVQALLEHRHYTPGSVIVRRGDLAHELFLIVSGRLSVTIDRADGGSPRRLTTLSDGTTFGEMAFVSRETRTADVHADTMVECLVLSANAFDGLMRQEPRAAAAVLANLLRGVGATARRLTDELALLAD